MFRMSSTQLPLLSVSVANIAAMGMSNGSTHVQHWDLRRRDAGKPLAGTRHLAFRRFRGDALKKSESHEEFRKISVGFHTFGQVLGIPRRRRH